MTVSLFRAGLRSRCPNCGEGKLYIGYGLRFRETCDACSADFTIANVGDGGTFFVMFLAFIVFVPATMILEFAIRPPLWAHVVMWAPAITLFSVALLRPFKATMFALQWAHGAGEARLDD